MADQPSELDIDEAFLARLRRSAAVVVALDNEGCVTDWSRGAARLFGRTREEALGEPLQALVSVDREDDVSSADAERVGGRRVRALERRLAELELQILQGGLPASFLLSGLHAVSVLLRQGRHEEAVHTLSRLGTLLRRVLAAGGKARVPLRDELAFLEEYADLEALRLDGELAYEGRAGREVRDAELPSLLLLPLVENAIRYGVAPRGGGRVEVRAKGRDGELWIEVRDDGPGLPELPPGADGSGGLGAVRRRIARAYGEAGTLELDRTEDGGAAVRLRLPMARVDEEER